ncbi:antitoxin [Streptomyces sp. NPDC058001]|uniref:antitoxin n=1 Tax=Streptomyces sp. NPDC058001 TaxID=3346300 RepID=UPI0036E24F5D
MSILDTLKAKLAPAKDKVSDLAHQHGEKIDHGLERAAKMVDDKTKGKYSEKIHTGTDKAKGALGRLAGKEPGDTAGGAAEGDTGEGTASGGTASGNGPSEGGMTSSGTPPAGPPTTPPTPPAA